MVYLLHFDRPIGNPNVRHGTAQHYIGFTTQTIEQRARDHRYHHKKGAAALMRAALDKGIGWTWARTWPDGDRELEKKLKAYKCARKLCPVCIAEKKIEKFLKPQ